MTWQLVPERDERQTVPLDKAIVFFGRHPECDVVITSSRKVSRKHCCVAQVNDQLVVRDLGSMNGVRVNGKMVRRQSPLKPGDSLIVGDIVFHLQEAPAERADGSLPQQRNRRTPQRTKRTSPPGPKEPSQDVPVVIPEEDDSFAIEESTNRPSNKRASSEAIVLSDADIIDDDDSIVEFPVLE